MFISGLNHGCGFGTGLFGSPGSGKSGTGSATLNIYDIYNITVTVTVTDTPLQQQQPFPDDCAQFPANIVGCVNLKLSN